LSSANNFLNNLHHVLLIFLIIILQTIDVALLDNFLDTFVVDQANQSSIVRDVRPVDFLLLTHLVDGAAPGIIPLILQTISFAFAFAFEDEVLEVQFNVTLLPPVRSDGLAFVRDFEQI